MHVVVQHRGHLQLLERADTAVGIHEHDEYVYVGQPAHPGDGSAAGIPAGGAENVEVPASGQEDVLEETAEQLQSDVLEGKGGPVKELQHLQFAQPRKRDHLIVIEGGVCLADQDVQIFAGHVVDEQRNDLAGEIGE